MLYADNSILRTVARCSTEAVLRHHHGLTSPEEKAAMKAGTVFHHVSEHFFKTQGLDIGGSLAIFDAEYIPWADPIVPSDDRLAWPNVRTIIEQWMLMRVNLLPFQWPHPDLIEIGFAIELTDDITFVGRLDGLVKDTQTDSWYVLENKSTGRISSMWRTGYRSDSQVSGYIYAASLHLGTPVVGAFINAIEFSKVPSDPKRKCKAHGVVYKECGPSHTVSDIFNVARTPQALDEWKREAINLATRYEALRDRFPTLADIGNVPVEGKFSGACTYCQFREFCAFGKPLHQVSTMLVEDRWEPYTHALGRPRPE